MATIGLDYVSCSYKSPAGEDIPVKLWDTAGQERFRTITYSFYKQANGVIIAFDTTNTASFMNVKTWLESIKEHAGESITKVLVGNKIDLEDERRVSYEEAKSEADMLKMDYFETSAKLDKNVNEVMQYMMENVYKSMNKGGEGDRMQSVVINGKNHHRSEKEPTGRKGGKCCQ